VFPTALYALGDSLPGRSARNQLKGALVAERGSQPRVEDVTRIVLRPIASPLPLGFFAFGMGSILQSALQFGLIPQADIQNLALLFGAFVFPLEILAALLAYFARESVGATILSIIAFS
jgi:uncharacterized protein